MASKHYLCAFSLTTALLLLFLPSVSGSEAPFTENSARKVIRVVDGDTLVLDPNEKVRLIGVDTPETVHPKKVVECFGREAGEFMKKLVSGKKVRLEFDEANTFVSHKDRYGRTLGYVFLEDGTLLNAEIIRQGYGHAYTRFPFRYLEEFRSLERRAREQGLGLWADCSQRAYRP
jgi:micrococcal nuclease